MRHRGVVARLGEGVLLGRDRVVRGRSVGPAASLADSDAPDDDPDDDAVDGERASIGGGGGGATRIEGTSTIVASGSPTSLPAGDGGADVAAS